jgi:hypothetical protein
MEDAVCMYYNLASPDFQLLYYYIICFKGYILMISGTGDGLERCQQATTKGARTKFDLISRFTVPKQVTCIIKLYMNHSLTVCISNIICLHFVLVIS